MRWVEMKCKCEVWSVGCEKCNVKCEESVCIVPGARAGHVLGQQHCNSFAQSTHARAWLAHGACKFLSSSSSSSSSSSTGKWFMKAWMTYEKRWDEKRWAGIRWEELRWDEVWSVKGAVWSVGQVECSVKCEVWSVKCEVWSVKRGVLRVQCEVKCGVQRVQCEVWSVKREVWSVWRVQWEMWSAKWSFKCDMRNRTPLSQNARTHGLGWRTAHASSIDEKGLIYIYVSLRQLPPRLVRVLLVGKSSTSMGLFQ